MPLLFGKNHLYRYNIQGGKKSSYLVFVHFPCLKIYLKHLYNLSLNVINEYEQEIIECLMNYNSLTSDCINYLLQRLQIKDLNISNYFGLIYFNKINNKSYWLDPNLSMRQQLPKSELKPNLIFTVLLYPVKPYTIIDEKARLIIYQQIFCNFISSLYTIPINLSESISAYFLQACFGNKFNQDKNHDILRLIITTITLSEENTDILKERIIELYCNLNGNDIRSSQNQFVQQISQLNTYGIINFELKNKLNETIYLGLNHHGIHSRSLFHNEYKLEVCWHNITSILSNKQHQIIIKIKNNNLHFHILTYYTNSKKYNYYCLRLFNLFLNHFSKYSTNQIENSLKIETPRIIKQRLGHGISVPNLRSDGEISIDNLTSSSSSSNMWTGSLPDLTVKLTTEQQSDKKTNDIDPNHIIKQNSTSEISKKKLSSRHSLSIPYQSQSLIHNKDLIRHSSSNVSTITCRSLLNSKTYLSSTLIPLEAETVSVYDDIPIDSWLFDFESKLSSNTIYDEFDSIPLSRLNSSTQDGRQIENIHRNRYTDVIPYDDTRVRLIPTKDNLNGYINASHIKIRIENTIYSYIAAESPLTLTVHDFWRMIFGSNVHVIIMLLGNDIQLCTNYFPKNKNEKCRTNEFEIELISEQNRQDFYIRQLRIKSLNGYRTRTIVHLQYIAWDNAQLPLNTLSFINFVNMANTFRRHYGETNPCLVHCTAGIGRTGIFILIHVMIQCITFNKKVSVASVLKVMREHRMSLVDRTYSYVFVYRCLIDYLKSSRLI